MAIAALPSGDSELAGAGLRDAASQDVVGSAQATEVRRGACRAADRLAELCTDILMASNKLPFASRQ